ncbi:MAG: tetratricopeptide repeat protein [Planctomycetota bacterium]
MIAGFLLIALAQASPVAEAELEARQAVAAGETDRALSLLEAALRTATEDSEKARLRDAYLGVGWGEPPPLNQGERHTLAIYVRNERMRVMDQAASRVQNEGKLHAAIMLRQEIRRLVGPKADRAKQEQGKIKRLIRKLTENPTAEDKELVAKILRAKKEGPSALKAARKLLEQGRYRAVVRLCQEMMFGEFSQDIQNEAVALRRRAEQEAVHDITTEEVMEVEEVLEDARFDRLDYVRSRHFVLLGPREFVRSIPAKDRMMLDLAYIFQSDLAAQQLTLGGSRLCVYYQETFDFGGGLAGGKLIRIGRRAIRPGVAGMLHYHELGHCIFGRGWLHHGFTEGLADFAAGFTLDALGQTPSAQMFITTARDQFVRYFLGRAVRYFDIQPYRPSAGFLFSFLPPGEAPFNWAPFRRAFHRMREAQFGSWPAREHQIMRYFGYLMATEYGPKVFDTLHEWGWPVSRDDWTAVPPEARTLLSEVKQGDHWLVRSSPQQAADHFRTVLDAAPKGPLAPRARYGLLRVAIHQGDAAAAEELKGRLGIVDKFKVLGPFHARKQTAYVVLPPENGPIDLKEKVRYRYETAIWKQAKVRPDGFVNLRKQGYGYPEHACAFALAYVHADATLPARIWLGSDDGHTLLVNGRLAEKRATKRGFRFDDDFSDVELKPGWNRILLKVHNSTGPWGFLMRLTDREGGPLSGIRIATEDHEKEVPAFTEPRFKAVQVVSDEFKSLSGSRWLKTVGDFDTQNGLLRPKGTQNHGLWQRFKVDPDKPPSGPANILWLNAADLAQADSFQLEVSVAARGENGLPAKFGITVDGENENDGQSGHTFVFESKDKVMGCRWYRYDHLLYLQQGVEVAPAPIYRLRLRRVGSKWWLLVNDVPLFEAVDAPRLPSLGLGILTWGREPGFESVRHTRLMPAGR